MAGRRRSVRWRSADGAGLEHLHLSGADDGSVTAVGVVIGDRGGRPYGMRYVVECDARWQVRDFSVADADGRHFTAQSDTSGNWSGPDGRPLPAFFGAIDIDLSGTPFTNTLPIRRADLEPAGEAREFTMLYVPFESLDPFLDGQRYRCVEPGRRFRYDAVDRSFGVDLDVDEDGLVVDYPGLFRREQLRGDM